MKVHAHQDANLDESLTSTVVDENLDEIINLKCFFGWSLDDNCIISVEV